MYSCNPNLPNPSCNNNVSPAILITFALGILLFFQLKSSNFYSDSVVILTTILMVLLQLIISSLNLSWRCTFVCIFISNFTIIGYSKNKKCVGGLSKNPSNLYLFVLLTLCDSKVTVFLVSAIQLLNNSNLFLCKMHQ